MTQRPVVIVGVVAVLLVLGLLTWRLSRDAPTLAVPPQGDTSPQWLAGEPVWVRDDGGEVTVLEATNPHPAFGIRELVGWCKGSGQFEAYWDRSRFNADGLYLAGPAPRHLATFEILTRAGGTVSVGQPVMPHGRAIPAGTPAPENRPAGCAGDGAASSAPFAAFHDVEGSGREELAGALAVRPDGALVYCERLAAGKPAACPAGAPRVRVVSEAAAPGIGASLEGRFLARTLDNGALDLILLPPT